MKALNLPRMSYTDVLAALQQQWDAYFKTIGHDFGFLTRFLEIAPGCSFLLSRLGNYRSRRSLGNAECGLCEYLEPEAELSHPALVLDGLYHFHVNIYPTVPYVTIFTHRDHVSMEANVACYLNDLRLMLRTAGSTGASIFHNMRDAASSIPEHEHFQALLFRSPVHQWPTELVAETDGLQVRTMPAMPGENYVFRGADLVPGIVKYIDQLGSIPYTLALLSQPTQIIIYPRMHEKGLYPERRWGGTEMSGTIACRQEMYDMDDQELAELLMRNYEHVLYPRGELRPPQIG